MQGVLTLRGNLTASLTFNRRSRTEQSALPNSYKEGSQPCWLRAFCFVVFAGGVKQKWPRPMRGRGHWVRYGRLEPQFPQKLPVFCIPHEHVQGPAGAGFGEPQLPQNLPVF